VAVMLELVSSLFKNNLISPPMQVVFILLGFVGKLREMVEMLRRKVEFVENCKIVGQKRG